MSAGHLVYLIETLTDRRIRPQQIHNNLQNHLANLKIHRFFSLNLKEAVGPDSINISNCQCKRKFFKRKPISQYAQARILRTKLLESLYISQETSNTIKKVEKIFQSKFCTKFLTAGLLPGIQPQSRYYLIASETEISRWEFLYFFSKLTSI